MTTWHLWYRFPKKENCSYIYPDGEPKIKLGWWWNMDKFFNLLYRQKKAINLKEKLDASILGKNGIKIYKIHWEIS